MKLVAWTLFWIAAACACAPVDAATKTAAPKTAAAKAAVGKAASLAPRRADVQAFAREMSGETGIPAQTIEAWLGTARLQPRIITAMDRPLLAPPKWFDYFPSFVAPERIAAGTVYWNANTELLARAEREYGVPPAIIVAILGIETHWGRNMGRYRALDALATLAFDYPRRARFFRGELKEFLLLAHEQDIDPTLPLGSFAGALGKPQFMPGSYRRFAIDFDADGHVDLWRSDADVIGSVAHFLVEHDWQPGQPTLLPALIAPAARNAALARLDGGISERRSWAEWRDDGVDVAASNTAAGIAGDSGAAAAATCTAAVGLLLLETSDSDADLYIACQNFYVITRYNKSRLYAAAVVAMARALAAAR